MPSLRLISELRLPGVLLAAFFVSFLSPPQTPPVNATIDASKTGAPISKHIYGQFPEHRENDIEGFRAEVPRP
jgi:hypothetical protein